MLVCGEEEEASLSTAAANTKEWGTMAEWLRADALFARNRPGLAVPALPLTVFTQVSYLSGPRFLSNANGDLKKKSHSSEFLQRKLFLLEFKRLSDEITLTANLFIAYNFNRFQL